MLLAPEEATHGAEGRGSAHDDDEHRSSECDHAAAPTDGTHASALLSTGCFVKRARQPGGSSSPRVLGRSRDSASEVAKEIELNH